LDQAVPELDQAGVPGRASTEGGRRSTSAFSQGLRSATASHVSTRHREAL